ncbi:MAG: Chemotaxis protein methyltransferase CheR [bacterium]|nr:Chemotaxis protein methyltransferase CheR [bacterium]
MTSFIDSLLHPSRRTANAIERRRARIAAGTAALVAVGGAMELAAVLATPTPTPVLVCGIATLLITLTAVALLRCTRRALIFPVLLTATPILALIFYYSLHQGAVACAISPWNIAVALFIADLISARAGAGVIAFLCFEVILSSTLDQLGISLPGAAMPPGAAGARLVEYSSVVGLLAVGALLWIYASSRQTAMSALDSALARVGDSEANLSTLVENTDAMVASLDRQGRWVTFNNAFREHIVKRFGREPKAGDDMLQDVQHLTPEHERLARERLARALAGERSSAEQHYSYGGHDTWVEYSYSPIPGDTPGTTRGVSFLGHDITARKQSEEKLRQLNRQVADDSRQAGMAEVATGILHNVGNTLNSVNVSASLAIGRLQSSRIGSLTKVLDLLRAHEADLGAFLSADPKGCKVVPLLLELGPALAGERLAVLGELESLSTRIDHIKSIVNAQQQHAKAGGVTEELSLTELLDDAVLLHESAFTGAGIAVERQYAELAPLQIDRHKLLQITVNLLRNARHALVDAARTDKRLLISVDRLEVDRVRVQVVDNGAGIAPENLSRMFQHGFTTKKDGHGFGLHMSALMARSMGGSLTFASEGLGCGAAFTLELPLTPPELAAGERERAIAA